MRVEEGAEHEHHACPELAAPVWAEVVRFWRLATGARLDVSDPLLTVMGLRPKPTGAGKEKAEALEPAWRLLHSVVLRQLHRARCRIHSAHHAPTPHEPKRATPRHVLREAKKRMQHELENQHTKAKRLAGYGRRPGVMSDFQAHWITTGVATVRKHGPRLNIFSTPPPTRPPAPGVHIHATGAMVAASLRRARAAGWAIEATDVGQDGHETLRLRARGIVPTVATHGTRAPQHAPQRLTVQAANHRAVSAALTCAARMLTNDSTTTITITVDSVTALRQLQEGSQAADAPAAAAATQPAAQALAGPPAKRRKTTPQSGAPSGAKRKRSEARIVAGSKDRMAHQKLNLEIRER